MTKTIGKKEMTLTEAVSRIEELESNLEKVLNVIHRQQEVNTKIVNKLKKLEGIANTKLEGVGILQ